MKKLTKYILAAALAAMTFSAHAQSFGPEYSGEGHANARYTRAMRSRLINWLPTENAVGPEAEKAPRRFAIAVRPFQLINSGLKLDFEMELNTPGQWLQLSLSGYNKTQDDITKYNGDYYYYDYSRGSSNFLSNFDDFDKFSGFGVGVAYKNMFSNSGWYWNMGLNYSYYNVNYSGWGYHLFYEDGIEFYEYDLRPEESSYHKIGFNVQLGKHFALTRNLFLDGFVGLGYERTFVEGFRSSRFERGMLSFGYSGLFFSGGFRIGWMWPNK
jgi:hypothetical protein